MYVCVTLFTVYYDAVEVCLDQLCPTEIFYWATNHVITFCESHPLNDWLSLQQKAVILLGLRTISF